MSYAPFESEDPRPPWKSSGIAAVVPDIKRDIIFGGPDVTECNYLVLFFVLGVFLLTLIDAIR